MRHLALLWLILHLAKTNGEIISKKYRTGPVSGPVKCPGTYCGRIQLENSSYSECSACPRGSRPSESSVCHPCTNSPPCYDWLYLAFMAVIPLILHWFCIDLSFNKRSFSPEVLAFHASALFETVSAAILAIVLVEPFGQFKITACPVTQLSDWYTLLQNPSPGYTMTLHCTQEAVYPLYSIVFMYYAISLIMMLISRLLVVQWCFPGSGRTSLYSALYFMPFLMVIHAVNGGLIFYSFPYIVIVVSVISSAFHFAFRLNQSMEALVISTFTDPRNMVILFGHFLFHAFGIIALTELKILSFHGPMLLVVPLPAIFYVITSRCTNPEYAISNV